MSDYADGELIVGIADLKIASAPAWLRTSLGSCVAVCLYAARQRAGGLLHVMMPYAGAAAQRPAVKKTKYADTGIAEMLRRLHATCGAAPADMVAKLFGGAKILSAVSQDIGAENEAAVRAVLAQHGIRVVAHKLGGPKGYKVRFELSTGRVLCQTFGEEPEEF